MTDQLISFETAKLAKEKGFRETTDKCFDVERNNQICNTNMEDVNTFSRVGNISAPNNT